ncbi:MAG: hypothetical protein ABIJ12_13215 [bacterium]
MDSMQGWYGYYFHPDQAYNFFKTIANSDFTKKNIHELFITWIVARFMTYQKKSQHYIGFPSLVNKPDTSIKELIEKKYIIENINFDTVIVDSRNIKELIRLQIKRYMNVENPDTNNFFNYMISRVKRYGNAPEVSIVFHVKADMQLDLNIFAKLLKEVSFTVGSIIIFCEIKNHPKFFLFSIHPNFTGELWYPD